MIQEHTARMEQYLTPEERFTQAIEIMGYCKSKKKSLVVEDLNFKQLKTRMLYRPKKENKTLSSFAYKKILEKLERKCLMNEVDVIKVDPKNTSKIGKEKYTKIKGLRDRKSTRLNSSHSGQSRMPSSA